MSLDRPDGMFTKEEIVERAVDYFVENKTRPFEVAVGENYRTVYQGVIFQGDVSEYLLSRGMYGEKVVKILFSICKELQNKGFYIRKGLY